VTAPLAWWVEYAAPESVGKFLDPLFSFCVSSIMLSFLESVEYYSVGTLDLSIVLWMSD
jgi:hypothetical protein